jgi:hypothetical protein
MPPEAGGMIDPSAATVLEWQGLQVLVSLDAAGWGDGGGTPWQVPQLPWDEPAVHVGVKPPWQYVLEHVADARFQVGDTPFVAIPPKVTVAVGPSTWPAESASAGFTWQTSHPNAGAMAVVRCFVCAPMRTFVSSAGEFCPQIARGGAPEPPAVPWHIVQFVFQPSPWHFAQAGTAPFPSSVAPWHASHVARFTAE